MNRKVILPALIGITAAAAWYATSRTESGSEGDLVLHGNVDIRQVEVAFRTGGRLTQVRFDEGESVTAGDTVATLDDEPFRHELDLAEADLQVQRAQLAKLRAGFRAEEIAQARSRVEEMGVRSANAHRTFERTRDLAEAGVVSQQAYDDARTAMEETVARMRTASDALALLESGYRSEDIAAAVAAVAAAEARLAQARTRVADAVLHAPASGVVLTRMREPGAMLAVGAPVMTLALAEPLWVRAYIGEPDLGRIHPGMEVEVTTDTPGCGPHRGRIGHISPQAEFTPKHVQTRELRTSLVFRLRIIIDVPDPCLRQGMPVTARILPAAGPARPH